MIAVGASNEIYRLNLDLGRFNTTLISDSPEINCVDYSPDLNVIATGGIDGKMEIWDMISREKTFTLDATRGAGDEEITSVRFEKEGSLNVAIGTQKGKVMLYDMRYPLPFLTLTHHYRLPIQ